MERLSPNGDREYHHFEPPNELSSDYTGSDADSIADETHDLQETGGQSEVGPTLRARFTWSPRTAATSKRRPKVPRRLLGPGTGNVKSKWHPNTMLQMLGKGAAPALCLVWSGYMVFSCYFVNHHTKRHSTKFIGVGVALYAVTTVLMWLIVAPLEVAGRYWMFLSRRGRRQIEHQFALPVTTSSANDVADGEGLRGVPTLQQLAPDPLARRRTSAMSAIKTPVNRSISTKAGLPMLVWSSQAHRGVNTEERRHSADEPPISGRRHPGGLPGILRAATRKASHQVNVGDGDVINVLHAISQPDVFGFSSGAPHNQGHLEARLRRSNKLPGISEEPVAHVQQAETSADAGRLLSESDWQALRDADIKHEYMKIGFSERLASLLERYRRKGQGFVESGPFSMSVIIRNIVWCSVLIWGLESMTRVSALEPWDLDTLPPFFYELETIFQIQLTLDYIIYLFVNPQKRRFLIHISSILDLLTLPVAQTTVQILAKTTYPSFSLMFGPIRLFRLFRIERLVGNAFSSGSSVKLIILGLLVDTGVFILTFACFMYVVEAPQRTYNFTSILDYVYYSIVTLTTVGYGDYSPQTRMARYITSAAILGGFILFPYHVQRLLNAIHTPPVVVGRMPSLDSDFVFFYGKIRPRQLAILVHNVNGTLPGSLRHILVVTPYPAESFKSLVQDAARSRMTSICVSQQCPRSEELQLYCGLARCVVILADPKAGSSSLNPCRRCSGAAGSTDVSQRLIDEDQRVFLKVTKAQPWCWPSVPIAVQLAHGSYSDLTQEIGAYHIVSLEHLKLKCIAKSASGCPGFLPLIFNLFHAPSDDTLFVKFFDIIRRRKEANMKAVRARLRRQLRDRGHQTFFSWLSKKPSNTKNSPPRNTANLPPHDWQNPQLSPTHRTSRARDTLQGHKIDSHVISLRDYGDRPESVEFEHRGLAKMDTSRLRAAPSDIGTRFSFKSPFRLPSKDSEEDAEGETAIRANLRRWRKRAESPLEQPARTPVPSAKPPDVSQARPSLAEIEEHRELHDEINFYYFFRGLQYQVYRLEFPPTMAGLDFCLAARMLYRRYEIFLIGLVSIDKKFYMNPVGYTIGCEIVSRTSIPLAGIVLSNSLHAIQKIAKSDTFNVTSAMQEYEVKFNARNLRSPDDLRHAFQQYIETLNQTSEDMNAARQAAQFAFGNASQEDSSHSGRSSLSSGGAAQQTTREVTGLLDGTPTSSSTASNKDDAIIREVNSAVEAFDLSASADAGSNLSITNRPLILVCGWPRDLAVFLRTVETSRPANVLILAAHDAPGFGRWSRDLEPFADTCVWLHGSPLSIDDLKNGGALLADSIVILSSHHAYESTEAGGSTSTAPMDNQVILVRQQLFALYSRVNEYLSNLELADVRRAIDEATYTAAPSPEIEPTNIPAVTPGPKLSGASSVRRSAYGRSSAARLQHAFRIPLIITELQERENMEFLNSSRDVFLLSAFRHLRTGHEGLRKRSIMAHLAVQDQPDNADWAAEGGRDISNDTGGGKYSIGANPMDFSHYAVQSEYRSGRLWLREMAYPLVGYGLPISRYAIDSSLIEHFVDGTNTPLAELMDDSRSRHPEMARYRIRSPLKLIGIPKMFDREGTLFRDVFAYLMKVELKLVFAVLRQINVVRPQNANPIDRLRGNEADELLISCPPPTMPLKPGDRLFALTACSKHLIGLFYANVNT